MNSSRPLWLLLIIIVFSLPIFAFPTMLGLISPGQEVEKTMAWLYIIYILLTDWLAWMCWPQRKAVTWILLALLLMSHAAMWGLILYPR